MAIRWREQDIKRLRTAVRVYNTRLTKEVNRRGGSTFLPARMNVQELRNTIETRQQFNNTINSLNRLGRANAFEYVESSQGNIITRYELRETQIKARSLNLKRTNRLKQIEGQFDENRLGNTEKTSLEPLIINFEESTTRSWKLLNNAINKQLQPSYYSDLEEQYKENYFDALYKNLSETDSYDDIVFLLSDVPAELFVQAMRENPFLTIEFNYDPLEANYIADRALNEWSDFLGKTI